MIQVIYESYWSPSQVKARSHPNMLATQSWMNQFYSAAPDQKSKSRLENISIEVLISLLWGTNFVQLTCRFHWPTVTVSRSGHPEILILDFPLTLMAEELSDGRIRLTTMCTAKFSKERLDKKSSSCGLNVDGWREKQKPVERIWPMGFDWSSRCQHEHVWSPRRVLCFQSFPELARSVSTWTPGR